MRPYTHQHPILLTKNRLMVVRSSSVFQISRMEMDRCSVDIRPHIKESGLCHKWRRHGPVISGSAGRVPPNNNETRIGALLLKCCTTLLWGTLGLTFEHTYFTLSSKKSPLTGPLENIGRAISYFVLQILSLTRISFQQENR